MARINSLFQQYNCKIHASKTFKDWFKLTKMKLLESWPAKLPDLNLIENVWYIVARKVYENGPILCPRTFSKQLFLKHGTILI